SKTNMNANGHPNAANRLSNLQLHRILNRHYLPLCLATVAEFRARMSLSKFETRIPSFGETRLQYRLPYERGRVVLPDCFNQLLSAPEAGSQARSQTCWRNPTSHRE